MGLSKCVIVAVMVAGCSFGCSKDEKAKAGTPIPDSLSGEYRQKALSEKTALPSKEQIKSLTDFFKKTGDELPNTSLFREEKGLSSLTGEERTKAEARLKESKAKLSTKKSQIHTQLVDNCFVSTSYPRKEKNGEGVGATIGVTIVTSIENNRNCPISEKMTVDVDATQTEGNADSSLVGIMGSGRITFKQEILDKKIKEDSQVSSIEANANGNFAVRSNTSEFGGGSQNMYGKVTAEMIVRTLLNDNLTINGGIELLSKDGVTKAEMALALQTQGLKLNFGALVDDKNITYLLNGNEYNEAEFKAALEQLFGNVNLGQNAKTTSSQISGQIQNAVEMLINLTEKMGAK